MSTDQSPKEAFSARLRPRIVARLRARVRASGSSQTALVERYIDEGLRMDEHSLISFRDGAASRRPVLQGSRLDVAQVVETIRQNDNSVAEAADYLSLPLGHVEACARYYAVYEEEVAAWIERQREAADDAETSWRRRQELFR